MALPVFGIWFVYFVVIESAFEGTLMHLAFNLKVKTIQRNSIGFSEGFKRHLLDPVDFFFFGIPAFLAIKSSEKHQRLGDMFANTIIVDITDKEQVNL